MTRFAPAALAMAVGVIPGAAGAQVADGRYGCQAWLGSAYVDFGTIRVAGGKLSPNPVAKTGGTVTGIAATKGGMTVNYTTRRGYREALDCKRV